MKDSTLLGLGSMICVSIVYSGYMMAHAVCGLPIPDGPILAGIVGAICASGGVLYGLTKASGNGDTKKR